jgi:Clp amino terminal domain, pathogenicity island component
LFERFSEEARQVVVLAQDEAQALGHGWIGTEHLLAQDEAQALGHGWIGTEHLLAGLLRVGGVATTAFESAGVDLERVRGEMIRLIGATDAMATGQIPFTPQAKKALEMTLRQAITLTGGGHGILPEHIALGVLGEQRGTAARILKDTDVDVDAVLLSLGLPIGADAPRFRPADDAAPEMSLAPETRPRPMLAAGPGFERYTERARQVVALAQDHARALEPQLHRDAASPARLARRRRGSRGARPSEFRFDRGCGTGAGRTGDRRTRRGRSGKASLHAARERGA